MTTTKANAWIVTGPTSGFGRLTALRLAAEGTVVLVGRDQKKLADVRQTIEHGGGHAVAVVCDFNDLENVARAARDIAALPFTLRGLVNNAGLREERATKNAKQGWDTSFVTNHLGPFLLTDSLLPVLPDGANVLFVASAVEDPERKPAKAAGFRGARYVDAEACARGAWKAGGSTKPGFDAYATSKQCNLATALSLARAHPRLRINAIEPGFSPATGLGRDAPAFVRIVVVPLLSVIVPLVVKGATRPERAAGVIAGAVRNEAGVSGVYLDDSGQPMQGSVEVRDVSFQDRVVRETRALLSTI